ncbi:hypothetical protein [Pantoea cypripedii]|uniref:hypothetical protein n=1 Tax=Pantoea cypripedii TaxID=55209 RepID=UPI001ABFBC3D|nr:hypothetical protein [Pantoea cypripedii]
MTSNDETELKTFTHWFRNTFIKPEEFRGLPSREQQVIELAAWSAWLARSKQEAQ